MKKQKQKYYVLYVRTGDVEEVAADEYDEVTELLAERDSIMRLGNVLLKEEPYNIEPYAVILNDRPRVKVCNSMPELTKDAVIVKTTADISVLKRYIVSDSSPDEVLYFVPSLGIMIVATG